MAVRHYFEEKNQIFNFESKNEINSDYYSISSLFSEEANNCIIFTDDYLYKGRNPLSITLSSINMIIQKVRI